MPLQTLYQYFGYTEFRPGQKDIIDSILGGQDTVAVLPTGGGKSICYQVPGLILPGTTIVVSPLISLMKDQVEQLQRRGIAATLINSSLEIEEKKMRLALLQSGQYKFIYAAPESLLSEEFGAATKQTTISLLVVDEAHCIDQWGRDFRPEYLQIAQFTLNVSKTPIIAAFTATATPQTIKVITQSLKMRQPQVFRQSSYRSNLQLCIKKCQNARQKELLVLRILLRHQHQKGIIYCATRARTEELQKWLGKFGYSSAFYHGGMNTVERGKVQDEFAKGETKIIAATNAFGMGVDIPDIRFVVHDGIPARIEDYAQEVGRAGRDGKMSECYVLWRANDVKLRYRLIEQYSSQDFLQALSSLEQLSLFRLRFLMKKYARHRKRLGFLQMVEFLLFARCRTHFLLAYFREKEKPKCKNCDHCGYQPLKITKREKETKKLQLGGVKQTKGLFPVLPRPLQQYFCLLPNTTSLQNIPGVGRGWIERNVRFTLEQWKHSLL
jgi:ATP-dependent DNA helicase RecQ